MCVCSRYELPVTATADNCLLTCYPFLAAHQTDFHIVCKQQGMSILDKQSGTEEVPPGEPVFIPCVTPNRPPTIASTSATSTSFGISTSTYPESSNEATSSTYPSTPHHGDTQQGSAAARRVSDRSGTSTTFIVEPGVDSDERKFVRKVIIAVQRSVIELCYVFDHMALGLDLHFAISYERESALMSLPSVSLIVCYKKRKPVAERFILTKRVLFTQIFHLSSAQNAIMNSIFQLSQYPFNATCQPVIYLLLIKRGRAYQKVKGLYTPFRMPRVITHFKMQA